MHDRGADPDRRPSSGNRRTCVRQPYGGPQPIDLPAHVVVDYAVRGTCEFTLTIRPAGSGGKGVASLALTVTGEEARGSWPITLVPGSYVVAPGDAVGCTFDVSVHAP
jgi:hypothetical protein